MSYRATENLRCYVREAVLPEMRNGPNAPAMPIEGHKSHRNFLSVCSEMYRKLESIMHLQDALMDEWITAWVDAYIPDYPLDQEDEDDLTGEKLSIPCPPIFNVPFQPIKRPDDVLRVASWLDNFPMQTVQRVLHLAFPQTKDWQFILNEDQSGDDSIFRHFFWTLPTEDGTSAPNIAHHSVAVFVQPPWVLSPRDFVRFAGCHSFPPFREHGNPIPVHLQGKERLWAKIWDSCVRKKCPWFVVSTYTGWAFGVFSKGWTTAYISSVYEFDLRSPTVIEYLLYWIASAMGLPGGYKVEEVPEPVHNVNPNFSIPSFSDDRSVTGTPSESSWDGQSEEAGSSAALNRPPSPRMSDNGDPRWVLPLDMRPPRAELHARVQNWIQSQGYPVPVRNANFDEMPSNPALSEWSSSSTSTVKGCTSDGKFRGEWLVVPPAELYTN